MPRTTSRARLLARERVRSRFVRRGATGGGCSSRSSASSVTEWDPSRMILYSTTLHVNAGLRRRAMRFDFSTFILGERSSNMREEQAAARCLCCDTSVECLERALFAEHSMGVGGDRMHGMVLKNFFRRAKGVGFLAHFM